MSRAFTAAEDQYIRQHALSVRHQEIADHLGRSVSGVRKRIGALGLARQQRRWEPAEDQVIRDGAAAGEDLQDVAAQLGRYVSETSARARHLGLSPWRQHKRRQFTKGGHVIVGFDVATGRYILEHRVVMAQEVGRPLTSEEIVHHINTVKTDNDPANLYLCADAAEHQRAHRSLELLLPELMAAGVVRFNRAQGVYELQRVA